MHDIFIEKNFSDTCNFFLMEMTEQSVSESLFSGKEFQKQVVSIKSLEIYVSIIWKMWVW